jgi:hypothetical protein
VGGKAAGGEIPGPSGLVRLRSLRSKEAVLRVHEKAGHPTAEIYQVPIEIA